MPEPTLEDTALPESPDAPDVADIPGPASGATSLDISDEGAVAPLFRLAVGPVNTAYYERVFARFEKAGHAGASWNWAACLCTLNWMAFRQLWGSALVYLAALAAGGLLASNSFVRLWEAPGEAHHWWLPATVLAAAFLLPGLLGNRLLYAQTRRRVDFALAATSTIAEAGMVLSRQASSRQRLAWLALANAALGGAALGLWIAYPQLTVSPGAPPPAAAPASAPLAAPASVPNLPAAPASATSSEATGASTPSASAASSANNTASAPMAEASVPSTASPTSSPATAPPAPTAALPASASSSAASRMAPASAAMASPSATAASAPAAAASAAALTAPKAERGPRPSATASAASASARAAAKAAPASASTASGGRFYINVGLFAQEGNARNAHAKLVGAGIAAFTQEIRSASGSLRTRVRAGPFGSRAEADAAAAQIRTLDLEAQVFVPPSTGAGADLR